MPELYLFFDIQGTIDKGTDEKFDMLSRLIVDYLNQEKYAKARLYILSGANQTETYKYYCRLYTPFLSNEEFVEEGNFVSGISSNEKNTYIRQTIAHRAKPTSEEILKDFPENGKYVSEAIYFDDFPSEDVINGSLENYLVELGVKYKSVQPKNNIDDIIAFFEKELSKGHGR